MASKVKTKAFRRELSRRAKKAARTRYHRAVLDSARRGAAGVDEEAFTRLPKPMQRKILAFDILAWLRAGKVKAMTGVYVGGNDGTHDELMNYGGVEYDADYCDKSEKKKIDLANAQANSPKGKACLLNGECHVCAKGGLFMAHVMRANQASVADVLMTQCDGDIETRLADDFELFDREQYYLIEAAFEMETELAEQNGGLDVSPTYDPATGEEKHTRLSQLFSDAVAFGGMYVTDQDRLAAIMINMIRHNGDFVPSDSVSTDELRRAMKSTAWGKEYAV